MRFRATILWAVMSLVLTTSAYPQYGQYQGQEPSKVSVDELVSVGSRFNEQPVITQGELRFGDVEDQAVNIFELRGSNSLRNLRVATGANSMEDLRFMVGQKVEVTGVFFDLSFVMDIQRHPLLRYYPGAQRTDSMGFDKNLFLAVTHIEVMVELESDIAPDTTGENSAISDPDILVGDVLHVDLRKLIVDPGEYDGQQIAVLGKFRGNNLYGDLSIRHKRTPRDFVIKTADAAIWVTGRRPRGSGFRLDPKKRRDTGEWLTVIGTPWQHEGSGIYYLRAEKIEIADEPDNEDLEPVKVVSPEELELGPPPEVTFTLPLAGERDIPLDSEFHVQFSNDMERDSFNRNVDLLYTDDDGIGNPFPNLEVSYDVDARTLTVKPNKTLDPGREIMLILYDAITDDEGQRIAADPKASEFEPGAAVVLTFATLR